MPWMEPGEAMDADDLFMMFAGPEGDDGPGQFFGPDDDGPEGGFRGFFGPQGDDGFGPPNPDGDFEEGPQAGLGGFFGWGAPPPPDQDGDFGPDGMPDDQHSGGMAFFFGGPDDDMPQWMDDGPGPEGPPMDLFNAPGPWMDGPEGDLSLIHISEPTRPY